LATGIPVGTRDSEFTSILKKKNFIEHNSSSSSSSSVDCRFVSAATLHRETAESPQFQMSGSRCQFTVAMFSDRALLSPIVNDIISFIMADMPF